jgi:transposase
MCIGCCSAWSTASSVPSTAPPRATRTPLPGGGKSAGQRSKKADDEGRTIVWVDQSGFYLLPMAVRTWAPRGHTPILRVPLTHDHLFMQTQQQSYHASDVVRFLRVLLRKISGKLLVIWDGASIHRGQPIKDLLARGAARRLHLEQLPGYAPELNPVEGLWNYLKRRELGNVCCPDLPALGQALRHAKERVRHKRRVLRGCIAQCGYYV